MAVWPSFGPPSVVRRSDGFRVGVTFAYLNGEQSRDHTVLYGTDGLPMAVWREDASWTKDCWMTGPVVSQNRIWLTVYGFDSDPKVRRVSLAQSDLRGASEVVELEAISQGWSANDDAMALWLLDGSSLYVFDRTTDLATPYFAQGGYPRYKMPQMVEGGAFMRCTLASGRSGGCAWQRDPNVVTVLLGKESYTIAAPATDGHTLVWIEVPMNVYSQGGAGTIWTSPFAFDAGALAPAQHRTGPAGLGAAAPALTQNGYYAVSHYNGTESVMHVYRLSDMRHWSFRVAPEAGGPSEITYLDEDEIWYYTGSQFIRQELSGLGPGDPP